MGIEIERKFLVSNTAWQALVTRSFQIRQGYLQREAGWSVRLRIRDEREGFITLKNRAQSPSTAREYEYKIPLGDAYELLDACGAVVLEKTRYHVPSGGHLWEIDVFKGRLSGLILAEVELEREDEDVVIPDWVDCEVTGDGRYYNASLVVNGLPGSFTANA